MSDRASIDTRSAAATASKQREAWNRPLISLYPPRAAAPSFSFAFLRFFCCASSRGRLPAAFATPRHASLDARSFVGPLIAVIWFELRGNDWSLLALRDLILVGE